MTDPSWWNHHHESTWQRVKAALRRDWEQTKADWSTHGHELGQGVGDTLRQAAGKEVIPPAHMSNQSWDLLAPTYRFGVGARVHYGKDYPAWDASLEQTLEQEWTTMQDGRTWQDVRSHVHHAWDHDQP